MTKKKMFGLLHEPDGTAVERHVRILKVSFGIPNGPDIHVAIKRDGKWSVEIGSYGGERGTARQSHTKDFDTKADAFRYYMASRKGAAQRKYPRKLPYFTFLRMGMDGDYVHDFDAIEQHGAFPNELDVVFLTNEPFDYAYQWWTAAELKCQGDGMNATRRLTEAKTAEEKKLADQAATKGEKYFPIVNGCYTQGCNYCKGDKPVCKPHGRLYFQLVNSPRIGGSCTYDTTGIRSIQQLFSCIQQVKAMTGRGDAEIGTVAGIPLKFVLRPYKTSHNGQPSVQYGVSLEFRAASAVELMRSLHQHSSEFQAAAQLMTQPLQIESGVDEVYDTTLIDPINPPAFDSEDIEAAAMDSEFYGDFEGQDDGDPSEHVAAPPEPQIALPKRKSEMQQPALVGVDN